MNRDLIFLLAIILWSCQSEPTNSEKTEQTPTISETYQKLQGKTMGTYYNVTFDNPNNIDIQSAIDSLLLVVNNQVSTYIPTSVISVFNNPESTVNLIQEDDYNIHFRENYLISEDIVEKTDGAFDPTVMPLVNYWGFGYTEKKAVERVDSLKVQSLLETVGFNKVTVERNDKVWKMVKANSKVQLDFSAIAKGYGVDKVGELLSTKGIQNYYIDIGGECIMKGKSPRNSPWRIGINTPKVTANTTDFQQIVSLSDKAIATSGNYRNYFEVDGKKYAHSIHPKTGFPEMTNLLSASVVADNCTIADAYATALMIMGTDKAFEFASTHDDIEAYLIYSDDNGNLDVKYTEGFRDFLK